MRRSLSTTLSLAALALVVAATPPAALAQTVQLAPFAGYQFGGSFSSAANDAKISIDGAFTWGGTLDIALSKSWRLELLYSKQDTQVGSDGFLDPVDLSIERYMIGVQEERGAARGDSTRYFGSILVGQTRFVPALPGYDDVSKLGVGITLGIKTFPAKHLGLRFEVQGFYTAVDSGGGVVCGNGVCLYNFSSSGFWQGNANAGLILAF